MTDTEAVRRLFDELAGEYDQHVPFFGRFGRGLAVWCGLRPGSGCLTSPRGFVDSLGPRLAGEFRATLFAGLERMHASGGITVNSTVGFTRARKPAT